MMGETTAVPILEYRNPAPGGPNTWAGLHPVVWARIVVLAGLMAALFWPNLVRLWLKTNPITGEANWAHSFFVPVIGLYYLYLNRDAMLSGKPARRWSPRLKALGGWLQLQLAMWGVVFFVFGYYPTALRDLMGKAVIEGPILAIGAVLLWGACQRDPGLGLRLRDMQVRLAESSSTWFGLCVLIWGILFYGWAIWPGQNDFFKDFGMIVTLFGAVLLVCGWGVMRTAWFPILFLGCAIPWPQLVYSWIALPLQKLAASAAVVTLQATGVEAVRQGTKLTIGHGESVRTLNVAEACAGLKSLMTFISVGAAVGFLSSRSLWQKALITLSAVPIAIFCNMMRVAGQGLLDHYVDPNLSQSFAHQFVGMIMLIPAFFLILLVAWVLDQLFIEEIDKGKLTDLAAVPRQELVIEVPRVSTRRGGATVPATEAPSESAPRSPDDMVTAAARLRQVMASSRPGPQAPAEQREGA